MTFNDAHVKLFKHKAFASEQDKIKFLLDSLSYLQVVARPEAAEFYCFNDSDGLFDSNSLSQGMIASYLTKHKEYDAYEISQMMRVVKKEDSK